MVEFNITVVGTYVIALWLSVLCDLMTDVKRDRDDRGGEPSTTRRHGRLMSYGGCSCVTMWLLWLMKDLYLPIPRYICIYVHTCTYCGILGLARYLHVFM